MPTNSAQVYYAVDGQTLDNVYDFSATPNGGAPTIRRVINRSKTPAGRRNSQKPDYTVSLSRDVLEGEQDFDWRALLESKQEFVISEIADSVTDNYNYCTVDMIAPATDQDGNKSEVITISSLELQVV